MIKYATPILLLLYSFSAKADQPAAKNPNPYLPSGSDLPLDTGPEGEIDANSGAPKTPPSRKWIDDKNVKKGPPEKPKSAAKSTVTFGTTCKENGKVYKTNDDYYTTCLENHRRSQERNRLDYEAGKVKGSMDMHPGTAPGVEVKVGGGD